ERGGAAPARGHAARAAARELAPVSGTGAAALGRRGALRCARAPAARRAAGAADRALPARDGASLRLGSGPPQCSGQAVVRREQAARSRVDRRAHALGSQAVSTTLPPAADFELELLASHDITLVRAPNPGPLTLSGTNSWLVGREPAFLIDPGPLAPGHLERLRAAIEARGGLGGIALTHDHGD